MMKSLLYVSHSTLTSDDPGEQVREIVRFAQARNAELQVTGALIYTGARFAQLLEGPAQSVDAIMSNIARDKRHDRIKMIPVSQSATRRFDDWAMAYAGQSTYVDRHIRMLLQDLAEAERQEACEALIELMWALNNAPASG